VLGYRVFRWSSSHAGCADSQIIEVGAVAMRTLIGEPERRNTASEAKEQAGSLPAARLPALGA
jgi:hypothetical protein